MLWFLSLPLEKRLATPPNQWNPASTNTYRSHFPIAPGRVENKEGLEIGSDLPPDDPFLKAGYTVYENNLWPAVDDNCPNFNTQKRCESMYVLRFIYRCFH